jgi:anaerobic nitric oxide reductase flavorubredoxin
MLAQLVDAGFTTTDEGFRVHWRMDTDERAKALQFGVDFASATF